MNISTFKIEGLFGDRSVVLPVDNNSLVLVGPNGLGKSSVANIFYYTISRQWKRLLDYDFERVTLTTNDEEITFRRDEVSGLLSLSRLMESGTSRTGTMVRRLVAGGVFEDFIRTPSFPSAERKKYAALLDMPLSEVPMFQRHILRNIGSEDDLLAAPRAKLEDQLAKAVPSRVLYLPTYRRIERDMREVFPGLEERYRRLGGNDAQLEAGRTGNFYVELVSFGMEDVKKNLQKVTQDLREYSLSQYNNLSASYLRDVIRGKADKYNARDLSSLDDQSISKILDRVSETALSREDKQLLRRRIKSVQAQRKADTEPQDRYMAHYFSRLVSITDDIVNREKNMAAFTSVCNAYIKPGKYFDYDEVSSTIRIVDDRGKELDLSVLSSGEKQIVSLFSHIHLEDERGKVVIIDEPELSLSVPWQRRFLTDIIKSGKCEFLLAVTHSPFVYDNELKSTAMDLRKLTNRA